MISEPHREKNIINTQITPGLLQLPQTSVGSTPRRRLSFAQGVPGAAPSSDQPRTPLSKRRMSIAIRNKLATTSAEQVFSSDEVAQLPGIYRQALERAFHRAQTREGLHKYDASRQDLRFGRQVGYGLMTKKGGFDDVVTIKSLYDYQQEQQSAVRKALQVAAPHYEQAVDPVVSIHETFKRMVKEVERTEWFSDEERVQMVNVFISDFGARYHEIVSMIKAIDAPPKRVREIIIRIFEKFSIIKALVLDKCLAKKQALEKNNVLNAKSNIDRIRAFFRNTLAKRINTEHLVRFCLTQLDSQKQAVADERALQFELRRLKDQLSEVSEQTPANKALLKQLEEYAAAINSTELKPSVKYTPPEFLRKYARDLENFARQDTALDEAAGQIRMDLEQLMNSKRFKGDHVLDYSDESDQEMARNLKEDEDLKAFQVPKDIEDKIRHEELLLKVQTRKMWKPKPADFVPQPIPESRYLTANDERKPYLMKWEEFNHMVESKQQKTIPPIRDESIQLKIGQSMPQSFVSRYSNRVPKEVMKITTAPIYSSSNPHGFDAQQLADVDAKLIKFKDIDQLYKDLTSLIGSNQIEFVEESNMPGFVPSAPNDLLATISYAYQGLTRPSTHSTSRTTASAGNGMEVPESAFELLSEAFAENQTLEYKGSRPTSVSAVQQKIATMKLKNRMIKKGFITADDSFDKKSGINVSDYKAFLRVRATDFLATIMLPPEDVFEEKEEKKVTEGSGSSSEELVVNFESATDSELSDEEELLEELSELKQHIKTGLWAMEEEKKVQTTSIADVSMQASRASSSKQRSDVRQTTSAEQREAEKTARRKQKLEQFTQEVQERLEDIWSRLELPIETKMDMAIKYSGLSFTGKLKAVLSVWEKIVVLIEKREAVLPELEHFERAVMNPARFFRDNSYQREQEAAQRMQLISRLRKLETEITRAMKHLSKSFGDTVLYKGVSYEDKMIHDYSRIQYQVMQEYKQAQQQMSAAKTASSATSNPDLASAVVTSRESVRGSGSKDSSKKISRSPSNGAPLQHNPSRRASKVLPGLGAGVTRQITSRKR